MIPINSEHIRYLDVGDTFCETGYWQCLNLKVIEKPFYNEDGNLVWKAFNIDTYKVVDYLVTPNSAYTVHLYYTDETYKRVEYIVKDLMMQPWQVLTLDKANISKILKQAKDKIVLHHTFKTTGVGDMVNIATVKPQISWYNKADYEVGGKYYIDPDTIPF